MNRAKDITIIVLLVAVVYLIATREVTDNAEHVRSDSSIAVLPFENMSGDPGNEYFSDMIWDRVISALATIPDLQVAARTSTADFKGTTMDVDSVGEALGVTYVLEGSVRTSGENVEVLAQLVRVGKDAHAHVWHRTYTGSADAADYIPTEIAKSAAHEIAKLQ